MRVTCLTLMLGLLTSFSFAANANQELTFDMFVKSCKDPGAFGHQVPPQKIKLTCSNVQTRWLGVESGSVPLAETRVLAGELTSDKYNVSRESFGIAVPEKRAQCPKFEEVAESLRVEIALTCDSILSNEKALDELCLDAVDEGISQSPEIVETERTGRIYDVCGNTSQKKDTFNRM